jgi:beta-lactamase regulating signal transducer with metallopeptidase domain/biotin carboxyl carrier protein
MKLILINGFAEAWLERLVAACWQGGLALGLVWLTCRLFPRISPRAQSWLWRLAYLKLVTALLLPASIDVPLLPAPVSVTSQPNLVDSHAPPLNASDRVTVSPAPPSRLRLAGWLLLGWSLGVGAHLVRVLRGWRQTRALRRTCRPSDEQALSQCCAETGQRLRLRQTPRIAISHAAAQPLLLGPLRPMIVLPASFVANSTPAQVRMLLAHELAHCQRLDLWWGWLLVLGESLFFFHPLVWLSRAEWRLTQEMACDALAVWAARSPLTAYGTMLLDISTSSRGAFPPPRSMTVSIVETKRNLERRLKAMQFIGQKPSRGLRLVTACLMGAAALGVLPWCAVGQSPLPGAEGPQKPTQHQADLRARIGPEDAPRADSQNPKGKSDGQFLKVFSLKYADAEELANHLLVLNRGKKVTVVADRRTNAIVVSAPPDEMVTITELIQAMDQPSVEKEPTVASRTETSGSSRPLTIMPPRPGFVQKVFVTSGKAVKKGEALVQLDDQEARSKLNYALAQVDVAKAALAIQEAQANGVQREYQRLKTLADQKAVSSDEVEAKRNAYEVEQARITKAQAELKLAEQQVEQNKIELSLLTIRAPVEGKVERVHVQVGEYVSSTPDRPLMLISR